MNKIISILIPVYNEEKTLKNIVEKVLRADTLGLTKEIIIINDGSSDSTGQVAAKLVNRSTKMIEYSDNRGKGYALRLGLQHAKGDLVLIQDADLEYDPQDYRHLIKPLFLDYATAAVYGSRELTPNSRSYVAYFAGGKLVTWLTNFLYSSHLTDVNSGYKVFRTQVLRLLELNTDGFDFCPEVTAKLLKSGRKIQEVPIRYCPRTFEEGKKIGIKDGLTAIVTLIRIRLV